MTAVDFHPRCTSLLPYFSSILQLVSMNIHATDLSLSGIKNCVDESVRVKETRFLLDTNEGTSRDANKLLNPNIVHK